MASILLENVRKGCIHKICLRPDPLPSEILSKIINAKRIKLEHCLSEPDTRYQIGNFKLETQDPTPKVVEVEFSRQFVESLNTIKLEFDHTYGLFIKKTRSNIVRILHSFEDTGDQRLIPESPQTGNTSTIPNAYKLNNASRPIISPNYKLPTIISDWMIFCQIYLSRVMIEDQFLNLNTKTNEFLTNKNGLESWINHFLDPTVSKDLSDAERVFPLLSNDAFNRTGFALFWHHPITQQREILEKKRHECSFFEECIFNRLIHLVLVENKPDIPIRITLFENVLSYFRNTVFMTERSIRFAAFITSPTMIQHLGQDWRNVKNNFPWLMFRQSTARVDPTDILADKDSYNALTHEQQLLISLYINKVCEPDTK